MAFKTFKGAGSMAEFCEETNKLFEAMNNIQVKMPRNYAGPEPTLRFEKQGKKNVLVFDMGSALVFTTQNVEWMLAGDGVSYDAYNVKIDGGKLVVNVYASAI